MKKEKVKKILAGIQTAALVAGIALLAKGCQNDNKKSSCSSCSSTQSEQSSCSSGGSSCS